MSQEILEAAACVCAEAFGAAIELTLVDEIRGVEPGYRHAVRRYELINPPEDAPRTVIVKQSNRGGGHSFNVWAALAFLNAVPSEVGLAPQLYGGSQEHELLVLEDLGAHPRLRDILCGDDPQRARMALMQLAEVLGELQATTCGLIDQYERIKSSLPPAAPIDFHQRGGLFDALVEFGQRAEDCGIACATAVDVDLNAVMEELMNPGAFSSFVHGDCCPSNAVITPEGLRLYDYEVAGFGHALLDCAFARLRHLNCLDAYRIPLEVQRSMESAYRESLSGCCPAVKDDAVFARGITAACAGWMAVTLRNLPRVLEKDKPRGPASFRQRILASLDAFGQTAGEFGRFQPLGAVAGRMRDHLRQRWLAETDQIRCFPAFE